MNHIPTSNPSNADIRRQRGVLIFPVVLGMLGFAVPSETFASDVPNKALLSRYAPLWNNSPFTSRPAIVAPEAAPEVNPLEDYALIGVSPSGDGFRVTLINRNDPTERIIIDGSRPNPRHDFEILEIDRKPGRPLATTVRLSKGSSVGTVGFEQSLLALTPPPVAKTVPPPNAPPNVAPGEAQPENAQGIRRQPRPRVVPPPGGAQQPANPQQGANPAAPGQRTFQGGVRDRTERRIRR